MSQDYWDQKHNKHHENTNQDGQDPDLELPFIFSPEHTHVQTGLVKKIIVPYQHILFFLAMPFVYLYMVYYGYKYNLQVREKINYYELMLMTVNILAVVLLLIYVQ